MKPPMHNPFISVIVPVYNVEQYLNQCVDSVLNQTFSDYELILVDDGSTDLSGNVCDQYSKTDDRIKVFHKNNGGLSSARNIGILNSKGKYVIFLDSDDYWLDINFIEKIYDKCLDCEYDVIRGEYDVVDSNGKYLRSSYVEGKNIFIDGTFTPYEMMSTVLNGGYFSWLFILKREIAKKVLFNEDVKFQEDIDFAVRLFSNNLVCGYIPIHFYAYRQRPGSIIHVTKIENIRCSFSFCDLFYEYSNSVIDDNLRKLYIYNSIMMYCWTIVSLAEDYYFSRLIEIDRLLNLNGLRKTAISRTKLLTDRTFPIRLYVNPFIFVTMLNLKHRLGQFIRMIFSLIK